MLQHQVQFSVNPAVIQNSSLAARLATNLKNLEYSGISLNMENSWNSQGIMCNLGEN